MIGQLIIIKAYNAYKIGKMIVPKNNAYFIYDQNYYLNEKNISTKMKELYKKQDDIYIKYGIFNYFFIVDDIDERVERLEDCAIELIRQISIYFNSTSGNTLIALFSVSSRRIRIQPGKDIEDKFSEQVSSKIIDDIKSYLQEYNFYDALVKLIDDIDYYYNYQESLTAEDLLHLGVLFGFIIFLCLKVVIITFLQKKFGINLCKCCEYNYCCCCCPKFCSSSHSHKNHYHKYKSPRHHRGGRRHKGGGGGRRGGGASGG